MKNQKGFTLIEMVVVLAIFSILAAIAYPRISGYMEIKREQYRENHEYLINKSLMQYYALTGGYYKADCDIGGSIDDTDAAKMLGELRNKTGALIANDSGDKYNYKNSSGTPGTGIEIKSVDVLLN